MANQHARKAQPEVVVLPEFRPINVLWSGSSPPFPSEQSARWQLRMHRAALVAGQALALSRGRVLVHPGRFASVIEAAALDAMRRRSTQPGDPPAEA